jgi:hypothetical protein
MKILGQPREDFREPGGAEAADMAAAC